MSLYAIKIKQYIKNYGCKLLSTNYINANTKLNIKCKYGDSWGTDFHTFQRSKHKACKKCNYLTNKKTNHRLTIHYLFSKINYPKWKYRSINLITLYSKCHKRFYKQYRLVNNTPQTNENIS